MEKQQQQQKSLIIRCALNYCNCTNIEICCLIDYVLCCIWIAIHSHMLPYVESCGGYKVSYSIREVLRTNIIFDWFCR